ncbi:MAG: crossover junction endodeoxyribonuclease RuvC, partial [Clostridiales bacterium]|nr:crossover junction endodeoxyribonuclease RuvC [Clostridiales bacterium]
KAQMQFIVKTMLSLKEAPKPDDAADALAAAICHGRNGDAKKKMFEMR